MKVDFYQLSRDPVEKVVAGIARKVRADDGRLLVVSSDEAQRKTISKELWTAYPQEFLANGPVGAVGAERQPILISDQATPENDAKIAILADGEWREEAAALDRCLLMFGEAQTQDARTLWRGFDAREDVERRIFKQTPDGRWQEGG
ncbi:MAG: DNA polymerase III subunit chi [Alteripontixanthobacter sp.]